MAAITSSEVPAMYATLVLRIGAVDELVFLEQDAQMKAAQIAANISACLAMMGRTRSWDLLADWPEKVGMKKDMG
jgi:hypothetical protein